MYRITTTADQQLVNYMFETLGLAGVGTFTHDPTTGLIEFDQDSYDHFANLNGYCDCHIDANGTMWIGGTDYPVFRVAEVDVVTGIVAMRGDRNADGSWRDSTTVEPWGSDEQGMTRADVALDALGYARASGWVRSNDPGSEWTCNVRATQ
jgi:hypothetical protein